MVFGKSILGILPFRKVRKNLVCRRTVTLHISGIPTTRQLEQIGINRGALQASFQFPVDRKQQFADKSGPCSFPIVDNFAEGAESARLVWVLTILSSCFRPATYSSRIFTSTLDRSPDSTLTGNPFPEYGSKNQGSITAPCGISVHAKIRYSPGMMFLNWNTPDELLRST